MPLQFQPEPESVSVCYPVEHQESELIQQHTPERPQNLFSSPRFDLIAGLVVGAVPLTLFLVWTRIWSELFLFASAPLLLVLCLLYFLALRPYRALRRGLMVGMALLVGGLGLYGLLLVTTAFVFVPGLSGRLIVDVRVGTHSPGQPTGTLSGAVVVGVIALALVGWAATIVRAGSRREEGVTR